MSKFEDMMERFEDMVESKCEDMMEFWWRFSIGFICIGSFIALIACTMNLLEEQKRAGDDQVQEEQATIINNGVMADTVEEVTVNNYAAPVQEKAEPEHNVYVDLAPYIVTGLAVLMVGAYAIIRTALKNKQMEAT